MLFSFSLSVLASVSRRSPALEYVANMSSPAPLGSPVVAPHGGVEPVGYFLRDFETDGLTVALDADVAAALDGVTHYRLLPAVFPEQMGYHFDGLATVLKMTVSNGELSIVSRAFASEAYESWDKCLFFGTGTSTLGRDICFQNPGVNLLPIGGQLWLTIDTSAWGRVDPESLATIKAASVDVGGAFTLNAHPACDPSTNECYVQHPCPIDRSPLAPDVCVPHLLRPGVHARLAAMLRLLRSCWRVRRCRHLCMT